MRRAGDESGETLVEVLVALVVIGAFFLVVIQGTATAVVSGGIQKRAAQSSVVLGTAAERIQGLAYAPCASTYPVDTTGVPAGLTLSVTGVGYWDSATNSYLPNCPSPDPGLQLVTLTLSSAPGAPQSVSSTLEVAKRQ